MISSCLYLTDLLNPLVVLFSIRIGMSLLSFSYILLMMCHAVKLISGANYVFKLQRLPSLLTNASSVISHQTSTLYLAQAHKSKILHSSELYGSDQKVHCRPCTTYLDVI
jgi:hypothetical protein